MFDRYISAEGNEIKARLQPDMSHLSETEVEVLDLVVRHYAPLTPAQLSKLSQSEPAWREAEMNGEMDYRLMLAGDESMAELVESDQRLRDALEQVAIEELLATLRS